MFSPPRSCRGDLALEELEAGGPADCEERRGEERRGEGRGGEWLGRAPGSTCTGVVERELLRRAVSLLPLPPPTPAPSWQGQGRMVVSLHA